MNGRRHHLYEPDVSFESFEEAEQLFNNCAYEGFFDPPRGYPDCDLCPVKEECLKFWDNYVIVEPLRPKQKERYLSIVARKARALKRRKRERRLVCEALTKMAQGS
jgi:hypothetical protein